MPTEGTTPLGPKFIVRSCTVDQFERQIEDLYRKQYVLHSWNVHEAQSNGPTYGVYICVRAVYTFDSRIPLEGR